MEISHVIRGEDHLSNTPKHILLFRALGADAAGVRAPAAHPQPGPDEDEQAQEPDRGRRLPRRRASSARPSSTTSRCSAGRPGTEEEIFIARRARRALRPRARPAGRRDLRPRAARVAQRPVDPAARRPTTWSSALLPFLEAELRGAAGIDRMPTAEDLARPPADGPRAAADASTPIGDLVDFLFVDDVARRSGDRSCPKRWDAATTVDAPSRPRRRRSPPSARSASRPTSSSRRSARSPRRAAGRSATCSWPSASPSPAGPRRRRCSTRCVAARIRDADRSTRHAARARSPPSSERRTPDDPTHDSSRPGSTATSTAWRSYDAADDRRPVQRGREYRYHPEDEPVGGREAIVADWLEGPATQRRARTTPATSRSRVDGEIVAVGGRTSAAGTSDAGRLACRDELLQQLDCCEFDGDGRVRRVRRVLHGAECPLTPRRSASTRPQHGVNTAAMLGSDGPNGPRRRRRADPPRDARRGARGGRPARRHRGRRARGARALPRRPPGPRPARPDAARAVGHRGLPDHPARVGRADRHAHRARHARSTRSSASSSARTTTSPSRSACASCRRGSGRCSGAPTQARRARRGRRPGRSTSAPCQVDLAGHRLLRDGEVAADQAQGVRAAGLPAPPPGPGVHAATSCWSASGATTTPARRAPSTSTSTGCAAGSRTTRPPGLPPDGPRRRLRPPPPDLRSTRAIRTLTRALPFPAMTIVDRPPEPGPVAGRHGRRATRRSPAPPEVILPSGGATASAPDAGDRIGCWRWHPSMRSSWPPLREAFPGRPRPCRADAVVRPGGRPASAAASRPIAESGLRWPSSFERERFRSRTARPHGSDGPSPARVATPVRRARARATADAAVGEVRSRRSARP